MFISNTNMHMYLNQLPEVFKCTGKLGYAIARNYRKLNEEAKEYLDHYAKALELYGETVTVPINEDEFTETLSIRPDNPNFESFTAMIEELAYIEHDVDIFKVTYSEAMNQLTAEQMIQLEWMLKEDEPESADNIVQVN